jgi:hypothetical protein
MIHAYEVNGLPVQTGDIVCTMNGKPNILARKTSSWKPARWAS